jgi:hypothetical protein
VISRRGPLAALMLGSFAVGMLLMLLFDTTVTRVLGMTALVAFMASGLFLVADPSMLDPDDDADGPDRS